MTVAAWDGRMLATDKMLVHGTAKSTTTKLFKVGEFLIAGSGAIAQLMQMVEWFKQGADPLKFPSQQYDNDESVDMFAVKRDGTILQYDTSPYPFVVENQQWAVGSGAPYARMAMRLGKTAAEAVALTSEFDIMCGNGVDFMMHEEAPARVVRRASK